jgi:hypothetical protein
MIPTKLEELANKVGGFIETEEIVNMLSKNISD